MKVAEEYLAQSYNEKKAGTINNDLWYYAAPYTVQAPTVITSGSSFVGSAVDYDSLRFSYAVPGGIAYFTNGKGEETNKMNTFSFSVNGKQFQVQDELQFIGLARVREVAQVFYGTKLFIKGKELGELKRVRVGRFHLFPGIPAGGYTFFTKDAY